MKTKPIKDLEYAIYVYYRYSEIGVAQICELFGVARCAAAKYKNAALEKQTEMGKQTARMHTVNTEAAYKAWGIDINDIERRAKKLKELGFPA